MLLGGYLGKCDCSTLKYNLKIKMIIFVRRSR
jgi:hypothetical protein